MSVLQALDIGLAVLVFAVAAWTIFAPGAFAATVGYVVYGLLLSLVWIRLFAVDVALTEAAIGSGVTGDLAHRRGCADARSGHGGARGILGRPAAHWRSAAFAPSSRWRSPASCSCCPTRARPCAASDAAPAETGLGNPVTAVLIAYRAFDTMLEKVVLVLAVVGVWSLAADLYWGGAPGEARAGAA